MCWACGRVSERVDERVDAKVGQKASWLVVVLVAELDAGWDVTKVDVRACQRAVLRVD